MSAPLKPLMVPPRPMLMRPAARWASHGPKPLLLGFAALNALVVATALLRGEPYTGVFWSTAACALAALFTVMLQLYAEADGYAIRLVATYQLMICVALCFSVSGGPTVLVPGTQIRLDLTRGFADYVAALLVPLVVPLIVTIRQLRRPLRLHPQPPADADPRLSTFLIFVCPIVFGRIISPYVPSLPSYLLRVASIGLMPISFFAGKAALRDARVALVWCVALAVNAVYHILIGARGVALIPLFFFALGVVFSLAPRARKFAILGVIVLSVPGVYVLGILGIVRDEIGRDDVSLVSTRTLDKVVQLSRQTVAESSGMAQNEAFSTGVGRVVPWANVVVPVMTPTLVPPRGSAGLATELRGYFQLFGTSDTGISDAMAANIGNYPANDYGFLVNEYTSVEWGVLADGWSRFGMLGGVIAIVLVTAIAAGAESVLRAAKVANYGKVVGYSIIITVALRIHTSPFLDVLRFFALYIALSGPVIFLINRFLLSFRPVRLRRRVYPE